MINYDIIDSQIASTAKIYKNCLIRNSIIGDHALVAYNKVRNLEVD